MNKLLILTVLLSAPAFAKPPECPIYKNKQDCLHAVADNYENLLDFINESYDPEDHSKEKKDLIEASVDIKKHENLACQKTCFN